MIEEIVNEIVRMSGKYSGYEIFSDWIKATAISISNTTDLFHGDIWVRREQEYLEIVKKHGSENMLHFSEMYEMLVQTLGEDMQDVLGIIYMSAGLGSKQTGQFFTPFHISRLTAEMIPEDISPKNPLILKEPSAGSGGMIIAAAKELAKRGVNYQKCMKVVAQDLDWKGVYMTYVQMSLLGIKGIVVQGDSLEEPYTRSYPKERILYTPAQKGMIM